MPTFFPPWGQVHPLATPMTDICEFYQSRINCIPICNCFF